MEGNYIYDISLVIDSKHFLCFVVYHAKVLYKVHHNFVVGKLQDILY